ncbi:hypothetical protein [Luteimonas sp. A478]
MLASLILATTLGAPEVRMPPDFYHMCITEHPYESQEFWRCAVEMDEANRKNIGPEGFKQLEVCRDALAVLDAGQVHRLKLTIDGIEIECEGRPPSAATTPSA